MKENKMSFALALGALGVVFGDIGTSPLYALRETLGDLEISLLNVLGVLSLIFWSLILVISIKYLVVIFRADNNGEGGALALLALLKQKHTKAEPLLYLIAIFGAGLLLGDGMLTPAISVTSAIEGLKQISPSFDRFVLPLSCTILILLFMMQSRGTAKIGAAFGPVILIWFITIALLGVWHIINHPVVLKALNPYYAYAFFSLNGMKGFFLIGGVFLVVTGGEALYADIGHFGKNPIRFSWFLVGLPCLLLNYFGQGAHLLVYPESIVNPFYELSPDWFNFPLVILATCATVIASQAVITATFSLTRQAVLLGLCPRISIIQTSEKRYGEIYIPQMNFILLIGTLALILHFETSSNMTHAYGIAVNLVMLLITCMVAYAARKVWMWSRLQVFCVFSLFFVIDLGFLGANVHKFITGGWMPVSFALLIAFVMYTWQKGLLHLKNHFYMEKEDISKIIKQLNYKSLYRLPSITAIFITDTYDRSGGSFLHFLKLCYAVPENILIVNYTVSNYPHVKGLDRFEITTLDQKVCQLTFHYGFMDKISLPNDLARVSELHLLPFQLSIDVATYFVEMPNIVASKKRKSLLFYWQERLFAFLMRNYTSNLNIDFYQLPHNRTIAIGTYCII